MTNDPAANPATDTTTDTATDTTTDPSTTDRARRMRDLWGADRARQNAAFQRLLVATAEPVPWAYDVWDEVIANLGHQDNHNRAIAAQVLCNLAKSDPEGRMLRDLPALVAVTYDPRFVTARHALQAPWKVGVVDGPLRERWLEAVRQRFEACANEKNGTLLRYDLTVVFRKVFDAVGDERVKETSLALIDTETDEKYRKKYARVWRAMPSPR